ncbi:MAG: hypothetical protein WBF90_11425, partial [Rivularia sp. (in: cyanobacteria)]
LPVAIRSVVAASAAVWAASAAVAATILPVAVWADSAVWAASAAVAAAVWAASVVLVVNQSSSFNMFLGLDTFDFGNYIMPTENNLILSSC